MKRHTLLYNTCPSHTSFTSPIFSCCQWYFQFFSSSNSFKPLLYTHIKLLFAHTRLASIFNPPRLYVQFPCPTPSLTTFEHLSLASFASHPSHLRLCFRWYTSIFYIFLKFIRVSCSTKLHIQKMITFYASPQFAHNIQRSATIDLLRSSISEWQILHF